MPHTCSGRRRLAAVRTLAITTVAVAALATGAGPPASAQAPRGTTLTVGISQGIDSLNPFLAVFSASTEMGRLMYDFLTRYSAADATPVPGLASHWSASSDGRTWTYAIRPDATWSDGQPVTARDVAFTFNLIRTNPDAATANGSFVAGFDSVTAPDPHTVVIHASAPSATMLALDVPIVPEHIWRHVGDIKGYANDRTPVVGDGPFQLVAYQPDQYLRFTANKRHWGGAPKIDTLVFRYFRNTDAEAAALRAGEIDLIGADANLTPAQFDALGRDRDIVTRRAKGRRFFELAFNPGAQTNGGTPIGDGHPALADVRVRTAIGHAIDRDTLVAKVLGGYGVAGAGYLPPAFGRWFWQPDPAERAGHDPARANQILDAAGYARGPDGVRRMPGGGRALRLRLFGNSDHPADQQVIGYLRGWLRDIGVAVDAQELSATRLSDVTSAGDYDMFLGGYQSNPDPDAALALQTCAQRPNANGKGGNSDAFFCDPAYDRLVQRQHAELDVAARVGQVREAQRELYRRSAQITLFYRDMLEAYRGDRFAWFATQPAVGGVITRQDGYWGYVSATPAAGRAAGRGPSRTTLAGMGVALLALAGALLRALRRRVATRDERE